MNPLSSSSLLVLVTGALLFALCVPSGAGSAEDAPDDNLAFRNLVEETRGLARSAMADYQAEDWNGFCRKMESALALRPDHPEFLYNSAAGQARAGRADSAFVRLEQFVSMGMTAPFDRDDDFATLHADPRWAPLLERTEANAAPFGKAERVLSVDAPELLPEGVAYDRVSGDFFLGGVRGRSVWRVHSGSARSYLSESEQPFGSVFGLAVDSERRRLFVCTAWMAETPGVTEDRLGSSTVHVFDLERELWTGMHELTAAGARRILNDLALDSRGNLYLTDNQTGNVYRLDESAMENLVAAAPMSSPVSALERLPIEPELVSPQGIVVAPGDHTLYIADYALGIVAVGLPPGEWDAARTTQLRAVRLSPIAGACLIGIDGLARHGNDLLAIQNGVRPHRVLRIRMDESGGGIRSVETLLAAHPDFDEPTLGVVVGDRFDIVANSQWPSLAPDGGVKEGYEIHGPIVLSIAIP